jgi:hypothetical protein
MLRRILIDKVFSSIQLQLERRRFKTCKTSPGGTDVLLGDLTRALTPANMSSRVSPFRPIRNARSNWVKVSLESLCCESAAASLLLLHLHGLTLCCAAYYWTNKYYNPGTREKTTSKYSSKYQHHKLNLLSFTKERGWNKKSIIKKINVSFVLATCFLISLAHVIADAELFAQRRNSIPSLSLTLARVQSVSRVVRFFSEKIIENHNCYFNVGVGGIERESSTSLELLHLCGPDSHRALDFWHVFSSTSIRQKPTQKNHHHHNQPTTTTGIYTSITQ